MTQLVVNPFRSEAQRRWMHANEPEMAERWEEHTPKNSKLPKRKRRRITINTGRIGRLDPTRTVTLRRQADAEIARRFGEVRRAVVELVDDEDALGLRRRSPLVLHAEDEPGRWITVKGNHVFIPKGKDVEEAIKEHFEGKQKSLAAKSAAPLKQKRADALVAALAKKFGVSVPKVLLASTSVRGATGEYLKALPERVMYTDVARTRTKVDPARQPTLRIPVRVPGGTSQYETLVHEFAHHLEHEWGLVPPSRHYKEHPMGFDQILKKVRSVLGREPHWEMFGPIPGKFNINARWQFHTSEQKVSAFLAWLKALLGKHLVGQHADQDNWWGRYIVEGWRKGAGRAFDDARPQVREWQQTPEAQQRLAWYHGTREEFLRSSFNWPVAREKVQLLASRTFTDLKGVTDGMAARIAHALVDGLTRGENPRVIARSLAGEVDVGRQRAQVIARTEIIRAHAEAQLDAFERLGVTEVGVMAEWATAGDERVCKLCRPLDGVVMKTDEAKGLLPRHPQCRCAWIPANVGEDKSKQQRTKSAIERAIDRSYAAEMPVTVPRTLAEQKKLSRWGAADRTIAKRRPKSVLKS